MAEENYYKKYEPFFGKWRVSRKLGEGAFGKVFEIYWDDEFGRQNKSALKMIHIPTEAGLRQQMEEQGSESAVRKFFGRQVSRIREEILILQKCKGHPNIVNYEDHMIVENKDQIGWDIFIRMELLYPISSYMNRPGASQYDVIRLWQDISNALIFCEEQGIIHRDIKPANIMVTGNGTFKLTDFGAARKVLESQDASTRIGTEQYMAPEVILGQRYDKRVDYYSLGCVIYFYLNQRRHIFFPPYPMEFSAKDKANAFEKRMKGEKIPKLAGVSKEVNQVLLKSLNFKPGSRQSSAKELYESVHKILVQEGAYLSRINLMGKTEILPPSTGGKTGNSTWGVPGGGSSDSRSAGSQQPSDRAPRLPQTPDNRKKSNKGVWIGAACAVVLLISGTVLLVSNLNKKDSQQQTVTEQEAQSSRADLQTEETTAETAEEPAETTEAAEPAETAETTAAAVEEETSEEAVEESAEAVEKAAEEAAAAVEEAAAEAAESVEPVGTAAVGEEESGETEEKTPDKIVEYLEEEEGTAEPAPGEDAEAAEDEEEWPETTEEAEDETPEPAPAGEGSDQETAEPAPAAETAAQEGEEPFGSSVWVSLYPDGSDVRFTSASYNAAAPDWSEYDSLIDRIKTETNLAERTSLMHHAEDILMATGAIIPIYYYNDLYLQRPDVQGIYSNLFGFKYFQFASSPRNVLSVNLASEPFTIDPALNSTVDGACLDVNLFAGLYSYDENGTLQPDLCDPGNPFDVSEDGRTYTFHLREGLKWSDGRELTAKDFEYSWKRCADPLTAADYAYMFDCFAQNPDGSINVTALDDHTLQAVLHDPCAYFLDLCAFPVFLPVPKEKVEAMPDWETNPGAWCQEAGFVTNGAYTVSSWDHDMSMVFEKNPFYHRAQEVFVNKIEFMLSADDTAIYAAYLAGDLDFADTVPTNEIQALSDREDFHVIDNLGTYYAAFNVNSPIFNGKTVDQAIAMRKAFSLLIDRQYIVDAIGQTEQKVATSYIPAGMADGNGGVFKENTGAYTYPFAQSVGYYPLYEDGVESDAIAEARWLLEYAGYTFTDSGILSADTPINITYLTNESTGHIAIAECIQQDLALLGINMSIETREWNVFLDERKNGSFDFAREGWLADYNDPVNMLEMWTSYSGNNDCQFGKQ